MSADTSRTTLSELFGDYRGEFRDDSLRSLFVTPPYFDRLVGRRPTFLIGGRGTGKTTSLRSLQFGQTGQSGPDASRRPYVGIYIRINKNRVTAFQGAGVSGHLWTKAFAHYFNLLIVMEFLKLHAWFRNEEAWPALPLADVERIAGTLGLPPPKDGTGPGLAAAVLASLEDLQLYVNNAGRDSPPSFSIAEGPVRAIVDAITAAKLLGERQLFCCIDEYENLLDYQQAVLNTYIKHSEPPLSYKVGVRRYGLRNRNTVDDADMLVDPDDYCAIDIVDQEFDGFALRVASRRFAVAAERGANVKPDVSDVLPGLGRKEEAALLGAEAIAARVFETIRKKCPQEEGWLKGEHAADVSFLQYWAEATGEDLCVLAAAWNANRSEWETRLNNYGVASLFWLSRGRKGARIRKYYCGGRTFLSLAAGNIRYFLELIDESLSRYFEKRSADSTQPVIVPPEIQTEAARAVAKRRIGQLESLGERGMALKRLALAIGKVFFELARTPEGRTPETTSFVLGGSQAARLRIEALLKEGVAVQVFEVSPRTKATSDAEMKDDEYRLHPIYCPFFEFSHRRKRRIVLSADTLASLDENPRQAISSLLAGRIETPLDELPEQLSLFAAFFEGGVDGEVR